LDPQDPGVQVAVDAAGPEAISAVPTAVAAFVDAFHAGPLEEPVRCTGYPSFEAEFGPSASVRQFFENGGLSAWLVRAHDPKAGVEALAKVDLFNILCLPGAADLKPPDMYAAYAAALACCERRRAFLIVDIPKNADTPGAVHAWLERNAGLRHRNAAIYFPRTLVSDPFDPGQPREIGASGAIAGLYARIDAARGVWKAPAGTEARLYGVEDFAYQLSDAEQGVLDALGVNCLRTLPRFGYLCWGARTLDPAREWKYIAVRRLALFIEESVHRGTQRGVRDIRSSVQAFLLGLYRQGAFAGSSTDQAYFVDCGPDTIEIGFAPTRPAEFVVISIRHRMGSAWGQSPNFLGSDSRGSDPDFLKG
jgi:phage tail sheath protein FI